MAVVPRSLSDVEEFPDTPEVQGENVGRQTFLTPSGREFTIEFWGGVPWTSTLMEIMDSPKMHEFVNSEFGRFRDSDIPQVAITFEDEEGEQEQTGRGEAQSIFSQVVSRVVAFLRQNPHFPLVGFGADRGEEARSRIYRLLAQKLGGQMGYVKENRPKTDFYTVINPFYQRRTASRQAVLRPEEIHQVQEGMSDVGRGQDRVNFFTASDRKYQVRFTSSEYDDYDFSGLPPEIQEMGEDLKTESGQISLAEIVFTDDHGSTAITGRGGGEVHDILNNVAAIVGQWLIANTHIAAVSFTGGGSRGRVAIYKRLTRMINPEQNYISGSRTSASFYAVNPHFDPDDAETEIGGPNIESLIIEFEEDVERALPTFLENEKQYFQQQYANDLDRFTQKIHDDYVRRNQVGGETPQELFEIESKAGEYAQQQAPTQAYESARLDTIEWANGKWEAWVGENIHEEIDYLQDQYIQQYSSPYGDYFHGLPRGASKRRRRRR